MANYDEDLLSAARTLVRRRAGQRGKITAARVRRSISTAYYALLHFGLDEASRALIGTSSDLLRRRRTFAGMFSHAGIKASLEKVRGPSVDPSVADLLRQRGIATGPVAPPGFARNLAIAFSDAQAKRHDADYDLNKPISEADARVLISRIGRVTAAWRGANSAADRDFKHALCMLMLLKGQLRREN